MARPARQRTGPVSFGVAARITMVAAVFVAAVAWAVSRALTDRFAWTQPVWWVPSPLLLGPLWLLGLWRAVESGVIRLRKVRPGRARNRAARGAWRRAFVPLAALVSLVIVAVHEAGLHRGVPGGVSGADRGPVSPGVCRLVFWNQAGHEAGDIAPRFVPLRPEVLVLANRHSSSSTRDLAAGFQAHGEIYPAMGWPFDVFSRWPVLRWGTTSIGLDGMSRGGDGEPRRDSGWAGWYELGTPVGPLVVWAVDLPSDPRAHRVPLARKAGRSIAGWQGAVRTRDGDGYSYTRLDEPGFPAPDVVVGDFNIPRGSASLGTFLEEAGAGAMRDSFAVAGVGWKRTWPREWPAWAIDHCFVAEGIDVRAWTTHDPGIGGHRAIVVDLLPGRRGP